IEELKQNHSKQTEIKYDIDSLEKQKAKVKTQQERLLELFLDDEMDSEMLKAKQSQMKEQLEVLDQQIKEAQQINQSQDDVPNFDKLKGRLILMITRFSVYLRKATPEAKNQLMKMLIDSIEITTDKQVKLVRYKIDESLIPQSLKKDWGSFFMPKFQFEIDGRNNYFIDQITTFTT
ncbi:recombinase family protein, partial [Staphylococcus saprophyticus]|nr:recombinase family protein [Staphylococcus saprophyticus]